MPSSHLFTNFILTPKMLQKPKTFIQPTIPHPLITLRYRRFNRPAPRQRLNVFRWRRRRKRPFKEPSGCRRR
ncbi:hypothetical protein HanXRQr2_Chr12g0558421 [Helianthus annuus]|uniref:Uncharacterized protein n=1 Tax=Helianthus annuus TaxID=4232 RepID=A0A9K3HJ88_HELAN|nr:hypothetical protein HanXRQr2_Chr12g0558421 [Helianthus annuus]KAJ0864083.1 hypothetical protein HanPSC8_Chr12g0537591 [Helianthus annuus]